MTDSTYSTPAIASQNPSPSFSDSARSFGSGVARITVSGTTSQVDTSAGTVKDQPGTTPAAPATSLQVGREVTAKSSFGATLTGRDIRPDSIVKVSGIETSVRAALAAGLIRDTGNGYEYADGTPAGEQAQQSQQQNPQQQQQEQQNKAPEKLADLDATNHALVNEFVSLTGNMERETGMREIIETGDLTEDTVTKLAGQMGIEPTQVRERAASVRGAYENQAREMVGPQADMIFAWAYESEPRLMQEAIRQHVNFEDPKAYDRVVEEFWLRLPADALLAATNAHEFNPRRERDGSITVQNKSMPSRMSYQAAVRLGYMGGKAKR